MKAVDLRMQEVRVYSCRVQGRDDLGCERLRCRASGSMMSGFRCEGLGFRVSGVSVQGFGYKGFRCR